MEIEHLIRFATGERTEPVYVASAPPRLCRWIGASVRHVFLSPDTFRKQAVRHRDIKIEHFEHAPCIIENGRPLLDGKKLSVVHIVADCTHLIGYWVKVTLKATKLGHEIWLTSMHKVKPCDIWRMERRARETPR